MSPLRELKDLDQRWGERLKHEDTPPLLGLAPLSIEDAQKVSGWMSTFFADRDVQYRFLRFLELVGEFPAIMALWLARKAGEAYEYGAFWFQFSDAIGIEIPLNKRDVFALGFQVACRRVLPEYIGPPGTDKRIHIKEFLFQAALPICHCHHFARHMRKCERRSGLPDPLDINAGEYLRDMMIDSMRPEAITVLKRALQTEVGHHICSVALRVVRAGRFTDVNPSLGEELSRAFQDQTPHSLRRAPKQPFMRLCDDLCSLDIIGPAQDSQLVEPTGMTWVVNGEALRHPHAERFVYPVHDEQRVVIELRGLRNAQTMMRTFLVDVADQEIPFIVFDDETKKMCTAHLNDNREIHLASGKYYVLHDHSASFSPSTESYDWLGGARSLSALTLMPGKVLELASPGQTKAFRFIAAVTPYLEVVGGSVLADDSIRIYHGPDTAVYLWIPTDELGDLRSWSLSVEIDGNNLSYEVEPDTVSDTGWTRCRVAGKADIFNSCRPALFEIQVTLRKYQRARCVKNILYWHGLRGQNHNGDFMLSAMPENLIEQQCANVRISQSTIRHSSKHTREASLFFDVSNRTLALHWSRRGTFLESFDRRPGKEIQPEPCEMGMSFSASSSSRRCLRIWTRHESDVEVHVNGQCYVQLPKSSRLPYIDISLATLALAYPHGGSITLHGEMPDTLVVASFAPPLIPQSVAACDNGASLIFRFSDRVSFLRPRVQELTRGIQADDYIFAEETPSGQITFTKDQCPTVVIEEVSAASLSDLDVAHPVHCIKLTTRPDDSPSGIWFVELEAKRSEDADWQLLTTSKSKRLPALLAVRPTAYDGDFRTSLMWSALDAHGSHVLTLSPEFFAEHESALPSLLSEVFSLIDRGFGQAVRPQFFWLENLCHDLSQEVSRTLASQDESEVRKLLFLASGKKTHSGYRSLFVNVPGLLALPSALYKDVSKADPLSKSLQWCATLRDCDFVVEGIQNDTAQLLDVFEVTQYFRNFNTVMVHAQAGELADDFSGFDYLTYWDRSVGVINEVEHVMEMDWTSPLNSVHAKRSLACLRYRREQREVTDDQIMGQITGVLSLSDPLRKFLQSELRQYTALMSGIAWNKPWLRVEFDEDHFTNSCARFSSMFALSARAAAAGWTTFQSTMDWLASQDIAQGANEKTVAALVGMAPELFGYYLMFWELMIRTYPHA